MGEEEIKHERMDIPEHQQQKHHQQPQDDEHERLEGDVATVRLAARVLEHNGHGVVNPK